PKPRIMTQFNTATGTVDKSPKGGKEARSEDEVKKAMDMAQKKMAGQPAQKQEMVDFFIRLNDYKKVGGLLLPHKLTYLTESEVSEEFTVDTYRLNPQFKSDKFQKH